MARKARIIVTHYANPVEPVVMDESGAANIHFGELTPEHARRERRRQRARLREARRDGIVTRYW